MTEPRVSAPKVMAILDDHLRLHDNKLDPKVHQHHVLLLGPDGDDGLCATVRDHQKRLDELEKTNKKLDNLTWAVVTAVVIQLIMAGIKLI